MRFKKLALFIGLSVLTGAAMAADRSERADKAIELIKLHKDIIIIDVRTPEEFKQGHLENAKNIPVDELPWKLDTFDKEDKVIVYCRSGRRSGMALKMMEEHGMLNVLNAGGFRELEKAQKKQNNQY